MFPVIFILFFTFFIYFLVIMYMICYLFPLVNDYHTNMHNLTLVLYLYIYKLIFKGFLIFLRPVSYIERNSIR